MRQKDHVGDMGRTGFLGKGRIWKDSARIRALGALDEAMSVLGLVRVFSTERGIVEASMKVQAGITLIMTEVASQRSRTIKSLRIGQEHVCQLDEEIRALRNVNQPRTTFLIPGESKDSAWLDFARVMIRKAERECCGIHRKGLIENPELLTWLNRASTFLFELEVKLQEERH